MKKFNKILVGTHNQGKFDEISFLLSKKIKKISQKCYPTEERIIMKTIKYAVKLASSYSDVIILK